MSPTNTRRNSLFISAISIYTLVLAPALVMATLPLVDFDRMGRVGLAGTFAGLDLFANSSSSLTFDSSTSTLLLRDPDGALTRLGSTNPGADILASCALADTLYIAGTFSSIGGVSAAGVASYSASSGSFSALGQNGPNGQVHALFCDTANNQLWAGGQFSSPATSVAVWNLKASTWSPPPFGGLGGAGAHVTSITTNASQESVFFSGSFITAFGSAPNVTFNGTNNPNVPFSAGATPFTSSLVPVPLTSAQIEASPSTTQAGFANITNVLCPSGADGPGNTWFAQDGGKAVITVRKFKFLSASGIRLGNTFLQGRGTTGFSVTTIPDNNVRTLHYTDPHTGQNQTCTDPCPLLTDPTIPYQDFLFESSEDITGFQLILSEWQGPSSGLHILQLLSSGAFASSIAGDNGQSCFAPSASITSQTGNWTEKDANTNIPGTIQAVLVADVPVGTPSDQGPTFTWMPYVSASGQYTVNLLVPGCTDFQDCALRTSVKVTVFPGNGLAPFVTSVSQQNTADTVAQIYQGPVVPTSPSFSMTVTLVLDDKPAGQGQNGQWEIVADRVQLLLNSANVTGQTTTPLSGNNGTTTGAQEGFGFFEWPLSETQSIGPASGGLPNSTVTSLDSIGFDLFKGIGGAPQVTSGINTVAAVAYHPSGTVFLGGQLSFSAGPAQGAANIVLWKEGTLVKLGGNGLDGQVSSLALSNDGRRLYVGGDFTDASDKSLKGTLLGVAAYNVQSNQWSSLNGGVNGAVQSLAITDDDLLLVAGNFTETADGNNANGFAAWNLTSQAWVNPGGFLVGSMDLISNYTTPSKGQLRSQVIAGHVSASLKVGAAGFVTIENGDAANQGIPKLTPLTVQLETAQASNATSKQPTTSQVAKRHIAHSKRSSLVAGWIHGIFKRQAKRAVSLAPLPSTVPSDAPAVFTGAYWTNSSTSRENAILGGNFTFNNGGTLSQNIIIYSIDDGSVSSLRGNQVNGTVRALFVQGDELYVGGSFIVQGTNFDGFAIYNLVRQEWDTAGFQPLSGSSGSSSTGVLVRSITASPSQTNTLIVAGSFAQAGSIPCRAICAFDTQSKQWSALGNGIQGEVASVAYAGDHRDSLVAAGSIALADGSAANVAEFVIVNATWSAVGDTTQLPGPVTAVEVNNGNVSSIFAAGRSTDGSSSFLSFWNGHTWSAIGSTFTSGSDVSQLAMVPLQNTHPANGIVEPDRMLWISGSLSGSSFGNISSALFDGQQIIPYAVSATSTGAPGTIASLIFSFSSFSFSQRHFLATGIVILISIAIAAGVVFFLALIGILWALFARKDDKIDRFDPTDADEDDSTTHRPSSLLEHINAATRTTILGQSPFGQHTSEKDPDAVVAHTSSDPFGPDASNFARAETPSDAVGGILGGEEVSRPAHARYSFDAAGEGELPMSAGQELEILDDGDAAWWYARDPRTGKEGVVPAAYVY